MAVMTDLDRFHLVADVMDRMSQSGPRAAYVKQAVRDKLIKRQHHIAKNREDIRKSETDSWAQ